METVISAIVRRMGEEVLDLSADDLDLAGDEVKTAIDHNLDEWDFIEIDLDDWKLVLSCPLSSAAARYRDFCLLIAF